MNLYAAASDSSKLSPPVSEFSASVRNISFTKDALSIKWSCDGVNGFSCVMRIVLRTEKRNYFKLDSSFTHQMPR